MISDIKLNDFLTFTETGVGNINTYLESFARLTTFSITILKGCKPYRLYG